MFNQHSSEPNRKCDCLNCACKTCSPEILEERAAKESKNNESNNLETRQEANNLEITEESNNLETRQELNNSKIVQESNDFETIHESHEKCECINCTCINCSPEVLAERAKNKSEIKESETTLKCDCLSCTCINCSPEILAERSKSETKNNVISPTKEDTPKSSTSPVKKASSYCLIDYVASQLRILNSSYKTTLSETTKTNSDIASDCDCTPCPQAEATLKKEECDCIKSDVIECPDASKEEENKDCDCNEIDSTVTTINETQKEPKTVDSQTHSLDCICPECFCIDCTSENTTSLATENQTSTTKFNATVPDSSSSGCACSSTVNTTTKQMPGKSTPKKTFCFCVKDVDESTLSFSQGIDLSGFQIIGVRKIVDKSVFIKWAVPKSTLIIGYSICLNGKEKSKILNGKRTNAMLHNLDLSVTMELSIYALTKKGRCEPPIVAIFGNDA